LRSDIGRRALTLWRGLRVNTEDVENTESTDKQKRKAQRKLDKRRLLVEDGAQESLLAAGRLRPYLEVDQVIGLMGPTTKTQAAAPSKVTPLVITKAQKKLPVR